VQLVTGRRRVHALHPVRPGDLLLHGPPFPGAGGGRGGGLPVERQLDAALGEDVVGGVDEQLVVVLLRGLADGRCAYLSSGRGTRRTVTL